MKLHGEYNEYGYTILDSATGEELYTAGNHALESSAHVPLTDPYAVRLATLARYCEVTGRELAAERNATFTGVTYARDSN